MKGGVAIPTLIKVLGAVIFGAVAILVVNELVSGLNPSAFFNQNLVDALLKDIGQ